MEYAVLLLCCVEFFFRPDSLMLQVASDWSSLIWGICHSYDWLKVVGRTTHHVHTFFA